LTFSGKKFPERKPSSKEKEFETSFLIRLMKYDDYEEEI